MLIIDNIISRVKNNKKKIILPESMDGRVIDAANRVAESDFADIIIIGKPCKNIISDKIIIIIPEENEITDILIKEFYLLRKDKGLTMDEARNLLLNDYMYYACMMVKCGYADGVVSGACHSTSNTLRPALQIIKARKDIKLVSSFFLINVPNCDYGEKGSFVFSDCGLNQNPSSEELAIIAGCSADTFKLIFEKEPNVAMLSHSTNGSSKHVDVDKVVEATKLAKKRFPQYNIDGEMQLDAAIIPEIAKTKFPDSKVAGNANVLIFPNLDAGNIGYKLVQRLAKADAYGPITQGIAKPVNDLSRGCSVDDIVGVIAITCLQATLY